MSTVINPPSRLSDLAKSWCWFVALGLALILLGFLALGELIAVTIGAIWIFGLFIVMGGVGHLIHAFGSRGWSGFFLDLLLGLVYLVGGFSMISHPLLGSMIVTLILGISIFIGGLTRIMLGLTHREIGGWQLLVLGGLAGAVLGSLIMIRWPESSFTILGLFVALDLISNGVAWVMLGFTLRGRARQGA